VGRRGEETQGFIRGHHIFFFETASRIGEFTDCELGNPDHCARVDDFAFVVETARTSKWQWRTQLRVAGRV
jgi:hypothetical protein